MSTRNDVNVAAGICKALKGFVTEDELHQIVRKELGFEQPPTCPRCGNNHQVWVNPISGRWTCHRAYCDTQIDAPLPVEAPEFVPQDSAWQPAAPSAPQAAPAEEVEALNDMLGDARQQLDMLREALGVPAEPHQVLFERMMDAARSAQAAQAVPHIWGYAVRNPKEPGRPHRVVESKDHADRVAMYLYESEIIPLADARLLAAAPSAPAAQGGASETLHKFLDAAAGEGLVLDGVDAADLYIELFPERYAAAQQKGHAQ